MTTATKKSSVKKNLVPKQIDLRDLGDSDNKQLRQDIIKAMKQHKKWRSGEVTRDVAVSHFTKDILDDLLEDGYVDNEVIVLFGSSKAKEMGIAARDLINWWNAAWRAVKVILGPERFKETRTDR